VSTLDKACWQVLAPGEQADLVLTDRDVTRIASADIHSTKALLTMVGGEIAHQGPAPVPLSRPPVRPPIAGRATPPAATTDRLSTQTYR
jgi:hypothetical protein